MAPTVFWPSALGLIVLAIGLGTYRHDLSSPETTLGDRIRSMGPVFIAAALATFSGEHFSAAASLMTMVPKWLPLRLAITYFVGVCLLSAGLSLATKKAVRWSAPLIAAMFAGFVLLIYLPSVARHPEVRMAWIFPFREGSFAIGALCIFVHETRPPWSRGFGQFLRFWTGGVLVFYGTQNILFPQFKAGVPDPQAASPWVPQPHLVAYFTGAVLITIGSAAFVRNTSRRAITAAGVFMTVLAVLLLGPDLFLASEAAQEVNAINFVADTLLFAGTLLVIARSVTSATSESTPRAA